MKRFVKGTTKFFVANLAVIAVIMMLPVFLLGSDFPLYNQLMDYIFSNDA